MFWFVRVVLIFEHLMFVAKLLVNILSIASCRQTVEEDRCCRAERGAGKLAECFVDDDRFMGVAAALLNWERAAELSAQGREERDFSSKRGNCVSFEKSKVYNNFGSK